MFRFYIRRFMCSIDQLIWKTLKNILQEEIEKLTAEAMAEPHPPLHKKTAKNAKRQPQLTVRCLKLTFFYSIFKNQWLQENGQAIKKQRKPRQPKLDVCE